MARPDSGEADDFDVIVVGAGYGGATAAALLTRAGARVLLLDKNHRAGGKALTIERAGQRFELWPIAGGPARGSRFHELVELLGAPREMLLTPERACEFVYVGPGGRRRSYQVPAAPVRDPRRIAGMLSALGAAPHRLGGLVGLSLLAALPERALARLDRVPMLDVLRALRLPAPVFAQLAALMNLLFVVPVDRLSASEAIVTLAAFQRGGAGRYHAGGFGSVAERAAEYVARHGGQFLASARVERILVEGGRVQGVVAGGQRLCAPVVISNAGLQPTVLRLVGAEHFPAKYVRRVRALEPSWALAGVRYELARPVFQTPMTVVFSDDGWFDAARFRAAEAGSWPRDPLLFVTVPALYDSSLARTAGAQVALIGTLSSPDPASPMNDAAVEKVDEMSLRLWPEIATSVVHRQPFTARHASRLSRDAVLEGAGGECIGLAQIVGQCGRDKPDARSPIPGLYFVGCDAGGRGCGTHQAVDSGFRVSEQVASDHSARFGRRRRA